MDITELLEFTKKQGATDLHVTPDIPPMIRVDGYLRRVNIPPLTNDEVQRLVGPLVEGVGELKLAHRFILPGVIEGNNEIPIDIPDVGSFRMCLFNKNSVFYFGCKKVGDEYVCIGRVFPSRCADSMIEAVERGKSVFKVCKSSWTGCN